MKNKKSLLSVLLAAVLLCACVAGMLVFGAGAEGTVTTYYVDANSTGTAASPAFTDEEGTQIPTFKSIMEATAYAEAKVGGWGEEESLCIELLTDVTIHKDNNLVFVSKATEYVERNDHSALPICISSHDILNKNTITIAAPTVGDNIGIVQFINDYKLSDVNLYATSVVTYYVCDRVELYNVTVDSAVSGCSFYASNNTFAGYGINKDNLQKRLDVNGEVTSELIISGNSNNTANINVMILCSCAEGKSETTGLEYFPASVTIEGTDKTLTREMFNAVLTVKDDATLTEMDGAYLCKGRGNATFNLLDNAKIDGNVFGMSGGTVLSPGRAINFNILGGSLKTIFCCYTGGQKDGILIDKGATINVLVDGGTVSSSIQTILTQNYGVTTTAGGNVLLEKDAAFNITVEKGSVGAVYGPSASIDAYVTRYPIVYGKININLNGGSVTTVSAIGNDAVLKDGAEANVTINGATAKNVYGVYADAIIEKGANVNLTLDRGTISGSFYLAQKDTASRIMDGATVSAFLNGGTYSANNTRLLHHELSVDENGDGKKESIAGEFYNFEEGSKIYIEFNGTTVSSAPYILQYVKIKSDVEMVLTDFSASSTARFLSFATVYGDVTVTADTTVDGWGGSTENAKKKDANGNLVNKEINIGTFHPGWSSYVYGNGTVNIDGGKDKTVTISIFYGVSAQVIRNNVRNATVTTKFEAVRGGLASSTAATAETGVQSITNNLYNVNAAIFAGGGNDTNNTYVFGPTESTVEGCTFGTYYGGGRSSKSDTRKNVTNYFYGTNTFNTNLYLGSAGGTIDTLTSTLSGTMNFGESAKFYVNGSYAIKKGNTLIFDGLTNFDEVYQKLNKSKGSVSGSKEIVLKNLVANNAITTYDVYNLVLGDGTNFKGAVTGTAVALADNANITIEGAGKITATSVGENVKITKADEWTAFNVGDVFVTAPAGSELTINSTKEYIPVILEREEKLEVRGYFAIPEVQLDLTERAVVKILISQADTDAYVNLMQTVPAIFVTMGETVLADTESLAPQFQNPVEKDGKYVLTIVAVGAGDFDKTLTFSALGLNKDFTILSVAQIGAEYYAESNPKAAALFAALVDYGKAAVEEKFPSQFVPGVTDQALLAYAASLSTNGKKVEGAEDGATFAFTNMTLLMGDTVGIRLKTNVTDLSAVAGATALYDGEALAASDYRVTTDANGVVCFDFFVNANNYETILDLTIQDSNDTQCLKLSTSAALVAADLVGFDMAEDGDIDSHKLLATVMLMMAVNGFLA